MGTAITIDKANHLFWLGRYAERVFTTNKFFQEYYDRMIDLDPEAFHELCTRLDIDDTYTDREDFCEKYMFDKTNQDSIVTSLVRAYDNAIVLREEIGSETLCFIEMPLQIMNGTHSDAPVLDLIKVNDDLYAFWGSVDDNVESEVCRNIMKCGKYVERLDLYYRFEVSEDLINKQHAKLKNRLLKLENDFHLEGVETMSLKLDPTFENKQDTLNKINEVCRLFEE